MGKYLIYFFLKLFCEFLLLLKNCIIYNFICCFLIIIFNFKILILINLTIFLQYYFDPNSNDPSHDWLHVQRVVQIALHLATLENVSENARHVIHLAALLHDVRDDKYHQNSDSEGFITNFLKGIHYNHPENIKKIVTIIENMSFRKLFFAKEFIDYGIEFDIVGDADRLDAIGAIGIARCMAFSAARGRALVNLDIQPIKDMTKDQYVSSDGTALNHFYEKLFYLKGMMRSKSGKQLAIKRHEMMEQFVKQIEDEAKMLA